MQSKPTFTQLSKMAKHIIAFEAKYIESNQQDKSHLCHDMWAWVFEAQLDNIKADL